MSAPWGCAWRRPLGDRPAAAERVRDFHRVDGTANRTKKGLPLGGIGAGAFMYNLCGSFGPWQLKPGRYEERFLPQAAFHVRERIGDAPPLARTLATEDVLPAWPRLVPGDGEYHALSPHGWCTYAPFATEVGLRFFSPVIAGASRESALPVAVFVLRIRNPAAVAASVAAMFSFPNAPYTAPDDLPQPAPQERLAFDLRAAQDALARPREGLVNELVTGAGATAVLMRASDPGNPPETEGSAWCIATSAPATAVASWDGDGDGAALWEDFAADGRLGSAAEAAGPHPAGALAVTAELEPGVTIAIPFVLAWELPLVEFGAGTLWRRRHADRDTARPRAALELARTALREHPAWLEAVEAWTRPIAEDERVPAWLRQGALNELAYTTFGGSFWENGCITRPKRLGARSGQHLHFVMECREYPFAETLDVRHHVSASYRELWPEIERDVLLGYADCVLDTPDGSAPHDAGSPHGDPWFAYDAYALTYPHMEDGRRTTPWSEFSPKLIQQAHAYWRATGDDVFLAEIWPALVRTYRYLRATDADDDGITEMKSSEYVGNVLFNAVLGIGAYEALRELAAARGDDALRAELGEVSARARRSADARLWDEELGHYRFNPGVPDLMADALVGQRCSERTGLPPALPPGRILSHLRRCAERLVRPAGGAANVLRPDGSPGVGDSEFNHEHEVWLGVSYVLAATMLHWARRAGDEGLSAAALALGEGVWRRTWADETTGYWFSAPEAWDIDDPTRPRALMYQRARGIWELLGAARDP